MKTVTVLIPVYNEAETITKVLERVCRCRLTEAEIKEIIVLDDASTDETAQRVVAYPDERVRCLRQEKNQGKGAALQRGFKEAGGDVCIIQDGDLEYNPQDYQIVLTPILDNTANVVYGSRFLEHRRWKGQRVWRLANYFLTALSNFFTGLHLTDMETCYKAFDRSTIEVFKNQLVSKRFEIEPELTAWVARSHARIIEVPISYQPRSYQSGKKIGWRDGLIAIIAIIRFRG